MVYFQPGVKLFSVHEILFSSRSLKYAAQFKF